MRRRTAYAGVEKRHAAPQFGGGSDGGFLTAEQGKPRHSGATVRDFSPDYMEQMLAFVVQRIERRFPKPQIRVRFPARVREATEDFVASFVLAANAVRRLPKTCTMPTASGPRCRCRQ